MTSRSAKEVNDAKTSAYGGGSNVVGWRDIGVPKINSNMHTGEFENRRNQNYQKRTARSKKPTAYMTRDLISQQNELNKKKDALKEEINKISLSIASINSQPLRPPQRTGRYYGKGIEIISYNEQENDLHDRAKKIEPLAFQANQKASELSEYDQELQQIENEKAQLKEIQKQEYSNMSGDQTLEAGRSRSILSGGRSRPTRPTRPQRNIIDIKNNQSKFKQLGV